jgi:hypothetical protein
VKSKNENMKLWLLELERQKDRERAFKETNRKSQLQAAEEKSYCSKCKESFAEPKLIQYYACPHCLNKIEEEAKTGCQQWFGYLSQKDKTEGVPKECVECQKVLECMLNQDSSAVAVSEIKKWY